MTEIGAFDAKTHLAALLERVRQGEEIVITRRGKAIARLVPVGAATEAEHATLVARLRAARRGTRLDGADWRELRDAGRR